MNVISSLHWISDRSIKLHLIIMKKKVTLLFFIFVLQKAEKGKHKTNQKIKTSKYI